MIGEKSKKKIRGYKRRVRQIQSWKEMNLELNKELLETMNRDYVKAWIYPFYSLNRYSIPNWYRKLIVDALIEICTSWSVELRQMYESYYLKIWLFDKDFMSSQVVVSVEDMTNFYDNTFERISEITRLDESLYTTLSDSILWKKGIHTKYYTDQELQHNLEDGIYTEKEIEAITSQSIRKEMILGESAYILKDDDVYVGEIV